MNADHNGQPLALALPAELLDAIAERVADRLAPLLADRHAEPYLDVDNAAAYLACDRQRVYDLVHSKRIVHHRDGRRLLFRRTELDDYVSNG